MKNPENRIFTVPNVISIIRLICIPFFVYFFHKGNFITAGAILVCSGITDLFDGVLARKLNQVTNLGKVLDPIADKLTEAAIAILLFMEFRGSEQAIYNSFLCWIFLFFIGKEALMLLIGGILLLCKVKPVAAEIYGKISTFSFYVIMVALLAFGPQIGAVPKMVESLSWMVLPEWITVALVITAALLAVVAFFSYFPPVYRALKESKAEKQAKAAQNVEVAFDEEEISEEASEIVAEPELAKEIIEENSAELDPKAISFKKVVEIANEDMVVEEAVEETEVPEAEIETEEKLEVEAIVTPEIKESVAEQKTEKEKKDFVDSLLDEILNDIKNKEN